MKLTSKLKYSFVLLILLLSGITAAQKGILSGKVFDKTSGETIIGAIVEIKKEGIHIAGAATDFDGNYLIEINPGNYEVSINYLSFASYTISDIIIETKEIFTLDVALESETISLFEIIVKADAVRSTDVALLSLQRKASTIQDGVSSQQISRTGSTNAAEAIRQLPAAVIQDGRFIVVRGLGDRYSISQLNGVTLPSTDPYRNSSSLDLIPGHIIENIISIKSFTPDLPGNFSGGLINIDTKSLPDKFNFSIGANAGYNSQSSMIENFQKHEFGGKLDWLGFDDGSRDQPSILFDPEVREQLSTSTYLTARQPGNDESRNIFHESARALSNSFIPVSGKSPLNMGLNMALGHRFKIFNKDFGFSFSLNYASNFQHYDDGIVATYINTNTDFLFPYQKLTESKSIQNPSLGGMFNMAYKISDNHILSGNILFNNDAEIISRSQQGEYLGQVSNSMAQFNTRSLEFIQRQITNYQLSGKHIFPTFNAIQMEWNGSVTNSLQDEPDLRYFAFTKVCDDQIPGEDNCEYYINNAEIAYPYHFFRKLTDKGYEGKMDITIPLMSHKNTSNQNSLKVGGLFSSMDRNFEEYRYQLNNSGVSPNLNFSTFNGNLNSFLDLNNFGIIDTTYKADGSIQRYVTGYHYINQINARNFYTGTSSVSAVYGMMTYNLSRSLKAIGGLRMEKTDMEVISADTTAPRGHINQTDYLYSINLVYALTEKSNLRIAGSQTLARPNLRELAPFVQFDTKNGFFNVGNPDLKRTLIQNYDLRYEVFPNQGELIAISAFYKRFNNPIIRAFNPRATIPELSFINVDEAIVAGVEVELRKELSVISPALKNFYLNSNFALIHSGYDIPANEIENSKNIDPEYEQTRRPFQGQAPFIVNSILSYIHPESGFEVALSYNLSGKKLYNISLFATPDVYEQPMSMLNFKASKKLGKYYHLSITAKNILNAINEKNYQFNDVDYVAESNTIGRTFGFALTYHLR